MAREPAAPIRVLVVDDNEAILADFERILARPDLNEALDELSARLFGDADADAPRPTFEVTCASQGRAALLCAQTAMVQGRPFDVAFVDMRMPPGWNGAETTRELWKVDAHLQVVICTADSDIRWDEVIEFLGTTENLTLLRKPFKPNAVRKTAEVLGSKAERQRRAAP